MQSHMHMRCQARQLDRYSTARHCSTARGQLNSSTDLDRPRRPGACSQARRARQLLDRLDRQGLDSGSTEPRQLDSSTARAQIDRLRCTVSDVRRRSGYAQFRLDTPAPARPRGGDDRSGGGRSAVCPPGAPGSGDRVGPAPGSRVGRHRALMAGLKRKPGPRHARAAPSGTLRGTNLGHESGRFGSLRFVAS